MSKPYDATTKDLLTERPRDLLAFLGLPVADDYEVEAIDADLSTVTAAADKILAHRRAGTVSGAHRSAVRPGYNA